MGTWGCGISQQKHYMKMYIHVHTCTVNWQLLVDTSTCTCTSMYMYMYIVFVVQYISPQQLTVFIDKLAVTTHKPRNDDCHKNTHH